MAAQLAALLKVGEEIPQDKAWGKRNRCYLFWNASYRGGSEYKNAKDCDGQPVFIAHELESASGIERRKRLAKYRNYCKAIVNQYNNFIFSNPIKRDDKAPQFVEWAKSVDGAGTTLHDFMKLVSRSAQIFGQWLVTLDTTKTDPAQTVAQAKAAGNRVLAIHVHPSQVLAMKVSGAAITEILVNFPDLNEVRAYDARTITRAMTKNGMVSAVLPEESHAYGVVPFVRAEAMGEQESQIVDIAEVNKSLFNNEALHVEELNRQTFTQYLFAGVSKADIEPAEPIGGRKFLCVNRPSSEIGVHRLAADTAQAASIREALADDTKEIYRLAGLWMPEVVQNTESGRALKIKFNQVALNAAAIADYAEKAENAIVELWRKATGTTTEIAPCDYPEEFDVEEIGATLERAIKVISGNLFPWIMQREQIRALVSRICPKLSDEDTAALEQELVELGHISALRRMNEMNAAHGGAVEALKGIAENARAANAADEKAQASAPADADSIGKIPLALQQLALAKQRALQDGDEGMADKINSKMDELLARV